MPSALNFLRITGGGVSGNLCPIWHPVRAQIISVESAELDDGTSTM